MAQTTTLTDRKPLVAELRERATRMRRDIIDMLTEAGSGHPGGSLSAVEIVAALYFGGYLHYDARNPQWPERDRFILSKGHGVPVQYAALAQAGFFPHGELRTLRKIDSRLQGHPVLGTAPGIEASTGSLGQGLSIGLGMALAAQLDQKDWRVFVLLGDGECEEGQVWEAALSAGFHQPSNLIAIVDYNGYQLDGAIKDILDLDPFKAKWESMRWQVREVDGHDLAQVLDGLDWAIEQGRPACLIAHTIKGKGVSFMEGQNQYHGVTPTPEERVKALAEFEAAAQTSVTAAAAESREEGR